MVFKRSISSARLQTGGVGPSTPGLFNPLAGSVRLYSYLVSPASPGLGYETDPRSTNIQR